MKNPYLVRPRPYPLKMIVDIHSYCNARCTMCPYPHLSRHQDQGIMSWDNYRTIIDELGQLAIKYHYTPELTYCYMGEPFLSNNLAQYIAYARQKNIAVYLNTNASAMTPERVNQIIGSGFAGRIHISMHGATPSTYERITGLDYERSLQHVFYLLKKYPPARVTIRGVDDGWPQQEVQRWHEIWRPRGAQLEYLKPISRCGAVARLLSPDLPQNGPVRLYGCRYNHPLVEMVVLYTGQAVMCCQDMGREINWGNVIQDGIETVWNGPVRQRLLETLYNGQTINGDFLCRRCEQALRWTGLVQNLMGGLVRKTETAATATIKAARSLIGANGR